MCKMGSGLLVLHVAKAHACVIMKTKEKKVFNLPFCLSLYDSVVSSFGSSTFLSWPLFLTKDSGKLIPLCWRKSLS